MKKILVALLTISPLLVMIACAPQTTERVQTSKTPTITQNPDTKPSAENKPEVTQPQNTNAPEVLKTNVLIAYFSNTGTTEEIAKQIEEETAGDLFKITPQVPYTQEDLNYSNSNSRASAEQADPSIRPQIANTVEGMEGYNIVFLGYPIWFGDAPRIINTFLESYNFADKTVIPFCTSGSSGIGSSDTNLHALTPENTIWLDGVRLQSPNVKTWIDSLGIIESTPQTNSEFNLDTKKVTLNSGYEMPIVGIGTYSLKDDVCVNSVLESLKAGGRLIDTAHIYGNEVSVGEGIRQSGVPREEIFLTTKLYMDQYDDAETAIDEALTNFDVEYIDLMLLHHPGANDVLAYKAMEQAVSEGKIRSIGLSNWYVKEMEEFLPQITITPAVVQNEIHPYYQENDVIPYMQEKGITVEGWYPLGGRGHTAELLENETISAIAQAHGKSSAQVILRWNLQKGVVVIPGSSNPQHIRENLDIFGFELTDEEMERINSLDRGEKHDWY